MDDELPFPFDTPDGEAPSARGILQCLQMLAQEASALRLGATLEALNAAIATCAAESGPDKTTLH